MFSRFSKLFTTTIDDLNKKLIHAVQNKKISKIKSLIEKGAKVDFYYENGITVLMHAVIQCHTETVEEILKFEEVRAQINAIDKKFRSALIYAAGYQNGKIINLLLKVEGIDARPALGYLILNYERESDDHILNIFLKSNANNFKEIALIDATRNNKKNLVEKLLKDKKIDINFKDGSHWTALTWAIAGKNQEILNILLEFDGLDVNIADKAGKTALIYAVLKKSPDAARKLLNFKEINVNAKDADNFTALRYAVQQGSEGSIKTIIKSEKFIANYSNNKLIKAILENDKESVICLLEEENIDVNAADENGLTPLIYAVSSGNENILNILLQDARLKVNLADSGGYTALFHAVMSVIEEEKETAAAVNISKNILEILLKNQEVDFNALDKYNRPVIFYAAIHNNKYLIDKFLEIKGVDFNPIDKDGKTFLFHATENNNEELVNKLLKIEGINTSTNLLSCAVKNKNKKITRILINVNEVDKNSADENGLNALMHAVINGGDATAELVKILLASEKINVNSADKYGLTAMMYAVILNKNYLLPQFLANSKTIAHLTDNNGMTALLYADLLQNEIAIHYFNTAGEGHLVLSERAMALISQLQDKPLDDSILKIFNYNDVVNFIDRITPKNLLKEVDNELSLLNFNEENPAPIDNYSAPEENPNEQSPAVELVAPLNISFDQ